MIKPAAEYHAALSAFITRLSSDMQTAHKAKGLTITPPTAFSETGRKFDKILISNGGSTEVRYFVERSTGTIYGAKSRFAPNLKWYFGTLQTASLWSWGDYHGHPVNDPSVRAVKGYGPYTHYMKV